MKKSLFKTSVLLLIFLWSNSALTQQNEFISGKLIDAKTEEPVVFGSIYLQNRDLGVISNVDGGFKIPLQYKQIGNVLVISSMGYQQKEIQVSNLSENIVNVITLEPALFELTEAVIRGRKKKPRRLSAKKIVKKAIDALLDNYPTQPYAQVGYYRDYQLDKNEYVNLNEAILEVFDLGFKAIDSATSKVLLYEYRQNKEFKRDSLAALPYDYKLTENKGGKIIDKAYLDGYDGNEFTILSIHNAIRNYRLNTYSFVYHLQTDFLDGHQFTREEDTFINEEALYAIKVYKKVGFHRAYGRLLISKSDFSIYKMEYAVYDDTKKNATGLKDRNGSMNRVIFEVNTSYRKKDAIMFLNYISFHNNFSVKIPPVLKLTYIDFKMHYDRIRESRSNLKKDEKTNDSFFELIFTEKIDYKHASNLKDYKAKFHGERIHFDSVMIIGKKVRLYPRMKTPIEKQMLKDMEYLAAQGGLNEQVLQFEVKNIRDVHGNIINQWKTKNYDQFREFFVQQVKKDVRSPVEGLFMKKDSPIFKDQPMVRPDNFKDYWMNTPLQKNIKN